MRTLAIPQVLADLRRSDPARPLVTFYDDATGERIELSVTTYANWVDKTAGLVQDELDVERGSLVLLDLPTHWLGAVWLGAAWTGGLCVTTDSGLAGEADLVVCGPTGVEEYAGTAHERPIVGISLRPLGGRFVEPLPSGVIDYGAVVLAQPDTFVPYDRPAADDGAWRDRAGTLSQAELLVRADSKAPAGSDGRLLTDLNPCSDEGWVTLLAPMVHGGGTIWVANPDEERWPKRYAEERATGQLRAAPST